MKVGDIIKFHVFRWDGGQPNMSSPAIWGRVTQVSGAGGFFDHWVGGAEEGFLDTGDLSHVAFFEPNDVWVIVPEEDVPDAVWAALAQRELSK